MGLIRFFAGIAAIALLAGCMQNSVGQESVADVSRASQIVEGTSTRADVLALLGEPGDRGVAGGQEYWVYHSYTESTNVAMWLPVVQLAAGRAENQTNTVIVRFNSAGVVSDVQVSCRRFSGGMLTPDTIDTDC